MSDDKALGEAPTGLPGTGARAVRDPLADVDRAAPAAGPGGAGVPISSDAPTELPSTGRASSGSGGRGDIGLTGLSLDPAPIADRYDRQRSLGRGGMGQIDLGRDRRIGREVAIKSLRRDHDADDALTARFLREARVQGQLEHPAIVPVHDVGLDADGKPYFVMKRLRGVTLSDIVAGLATGDEGWIEKHSRRKLLTNFVEVCQAIEFAHSRGVLHRDLKPANIMLGDFGETYVLDWGLAKIAGLDDDGGYPVADLEDTGVAYTAVGASIGTPGYMSPEQLSGDTVLDVRTDVYALGCVLFEILTLTPLNGGSTVTERCDATLRGRDVLAALNRPALNVPPELAVICAEATAVDPVQRLGTVKQLREHIDDYLDGDRDLERRRSLAVALATEAAATCKRALASDEQQARESALAMVNRALALDPDNAAAQETLLTLLVNPPRRPPPAVLQAVSDAELASSKFEARLAVWVYASIFLFGPCLMWMGVKSWLLFFSMAGLTIGQIVAAAIYSRTRAPRVWLIVSAMMMNAAFTVLASRMFGPLVLVPGIMGGATSLLSMHFNRRFTAAAVIVGCAAVVAPVLLEVFGILPPSYSFGPDGMTIRPQLMGLPEGMTLFTMTAIAALIVALPALTISRLKRELASSQLHHQTQAWQLNLLISQHTQGRHVEASPPPPETSCGIDAYFGVRVARRATNAEAR